MGEDKVETQVLVLESLVGFLHELDEDTAEVTIFEDSVPREYNLPSSHFTRVGIREGDSFYLNVLRQGQKIVGEIQPFNEIDLQARKIEEYLTPEQLNGLSDSWD